MHVALRRIVLAAFCAPIASIGIAQQNTLLILADDVGIDAIGAYGVGKAPPPTPNIDALAKNGILFRHSYANPICSPTRAAIHTGRYCFRTGVGAVVSYGNGVPLDRAEFTLPEALSAGGYESALIGKWHLGDARNGGDAGPNLAGWPHYSGHMWNIKSPETYFAWRKVVNGKRATQRVYATTDNVNDAITWIAARKKPWVLCLFFNTAHAPFHAPPSALHTYNLTGKNPSLQPIPFFKAMVQAMDREVGRLLQSIGASTLAKTNVIFLGDNGTPPRVSESPFLGTHAKTTLYEGGIRVPLIVSGPSVRTPGRHVNALVEAVDLFPTVLELSGLVVDKVVPKSRVLDGVSLLPYLRNVSQQPLKQHVYAERFGSTNNRNQDGVAIRDARYKLIRWSTPVREAFYDVANDSFEKTNLLTRRLTVGEKAAYNSLARELTRLRADVLPYGKACTASSKPRMDLLFRDGPRIGRSFTTEIAGLTTNSAVVIGLLGFSRTSWGTFALPLDLAVAGMPGCALLAAPDLLVPLTAQNGSARWSFSLPMDTALIGARFFEQALVPEASANAAGLLASDALRATIGNF